MNFNSRMFTLYRCHSHLQAKGMEPQVTHRWLCEERQRDAEGCLPARNEGGKKGAAASDGPPVGSGAGQAVVVTAEDIRESVFPLEVCVSEGQLWVGNWLLGLKRRPSRSRHCLFF